MSVTVFLLGEVVQRYQVTPHQLAEVTGLSPATIRALSQNRRTRLNLGQLTALLDVLTDQSLDIGDLLEYRPDFLPDHPAALARRLQTLEPSTTDELMPISPTQDRALR